MRSAGSGRTTARGAATGPLSGLGGIRDLLGHVLRLRLAGEQPLDRVVDGLPDRRRVRLVEIELDEGGVAAGGEDRLHVRVRDRVLGALGDGEDRPARARLGGDLGAEQELHEVAGPRGPVLADGEAVPAAELLAGLAGAAWDGREREP